MDQAALLRVFPLPCTCYPDSRWCCSFQVFQWARVSCVAHAYGGKWASQAVLAVKNLPMQEMQETWVWSSALGRSRGGGHGNPLHYSCLESSTDRGAWWATVHGIAKSQTGLKRLSTQHAHEEELSYSPETKYTVTKQAHFPVQIHSCRFCTVVTWRIKNITRQTTDPKVRDEVLLKLQIPSLGSSS